MAPSLECPDPCYQFQIATRSHMLCCLARNDDKVIFFGQQKCGTEFTNGSTK